VGDVVGLMRYFQQMSEALISHLDIDEAKALTLLHIIFVIPMIVNDVNLSVAFRGVSGLSS
jgi:hypothetical protein